MQPRSDRERSSQCARSALANICGLALTPAQFELRAKAAQEPRAKAPVNSRELFTKPSHSNVTLSLRCPIELERSGKRTDRWRSRRLSWS